jgi:predicted dehydrogenase
VDTFPLHLAFLGCGFITRVHSRHLRRMRREIQVSYASRDPRRAEEYCRRFGGHRHFGTYEEALDDPGIHAVVIAVPPRYHRDLALQALERGKHVLVEKPAFPSLDDFHQVMEARDTAERVVIVGENDHYKPLAVRLRSLLSEGAIGELVFGLFTSVARKPKTSSDWRNDESMAGGDAFFEEGIHWLHLAGSLGPAIQRIQGVRPPLASAGPLGGDARRKSMLVAFQYETGAAGAILYSREIPSLLRGLRISKLFGREGVITFESNGVFVLVRSGGLPKLIFPGFRDIRGYKAMYRDFFRAIREKGAPEMSLERALEDQALMENLYASVEEWGW